MIKNNIVLDNIYIDNEDYIKKLDDKNEKLKNEIMRKYDTLDEVELKKIIDDINNNKANSMKYIVDKNEEKNKLKKQKEELNNQYMVLKKKKETEERSKKKEDNNSYMIDNVITFNQHPKYPTGCESVALYILLRYYNIDVSVDQIIEKLEKGDLPHMENSVMYGGNPNLEFIGNPYNKDSYGVYDNPIIQVAKQYKSNVINGTGKSFDEILNIVKQKRPVMVWTSMYLALPYISISWIYKPSGEKINWIANEHAVVVIGQDNDNVIISDPIGGTIKSQNKKLFEERYNFYGKRNLYY